MKKTKPEDTVSTVIISGSKDTTVYPVVQESRVSDREMYIDTVRIHTYSGAEELVYQKLRNVFEKHGIKEAENARVEVHIGCDASRMSKHLSLFDASFDDNEIIFK